MLTIDLGSVPAFLDNNWAWATGLAASMLALTLFAGKLLNPDRKDEIALWLTGAQSEENWARTFTSLFDTVFGGRHLSLRCLLRSAIASLVAVFVIWLLIGGVPELRGRIDIEDMDFFTVVGIALAVNIVADYISLLETRLLLGWMHRRRTFVVQLGILAFDLALSAAIIWLAIYAYLNSPLYDGEAQSFAEILGLFSIFSVIFYSTFLTSVWSWAFILSTWLLRIFQQLNLPYLLNVKLKPMLILGNVLAGIVFLGSLAIAPLLQKDNHGVSRADLALCSVFKGEVCLEVSKLTEEERLQLDLVLLACEGGVTEQCQARGMRDYKITPEDAARLWKAACEGGSLRSCVSFGYVLAEGLGGVDVDHETANGFFRQGCDAGIGEACVNLGFSLEHGEGMEPDLAAAVRLYRQSCDDGYFLGCNNIGFLYEKGKGAPADPVAAAVLYRQACDAGHEVGCYNLGRLHENGIGKAADPVAAAKLYYQSCDGGFAKGCAIFVELHEKGVWMPVDPAVAGGLHQQSCSMREEDDCQPAGNLNSSR